MWFRLGLVAFSIIGEVIEVEWKRDSYNVHDGGGPVCRAWCSQGYTTPLTAKPLRP